MLKFEIAKVGILRARIGSFTYVIPMVRQPRNSLGRLVRSTVGPIVIESYLSSPYAFNSLASLSMTDGYFRADSS